MTYLDRQDDPRFEFWFQLSDEERDKLNRSARRSPLELPRYPYWDHALCAELLYWADLEVDLLTDYNDWLKRLMHRAERQGREWNRQEFLRQCRLHEAGE